MEGYVISDKFTTWYDLEHLIAFPKPLRLSSLSRKSIKDSNQILSKILRSKKVIYGVNTGFGKLSHVKIDTSKLKQLQLNLIRSHATGVGLSLIHI